MKKYLLPRHYYSLKIIIFSLFIINYQLHSQSIETFKPAPGKQVLVTEGFIGDIIDGYWLYLPITHNLNKKWPIILFLAGGNGVGGKLTSSKDSGPVKYAFKYNDDKHLNKYTKDTFIIINPHMRDGGYWDRQWYQQYNSLNSILDDVIKKYSGDPKRIYVTGLSRGGNGTWGLAEILYNRIAAIIPVCGQTHGVTDFSKIKNTPVWIIHSTGDPYHKYELSLKAVNSIESSGGDKFLRLSTTSPEDEDYLKHKHIFSTIESNDHDVWSITYDKPQIYKWLLQFKTE